LITDVPGVLVGHWTDPVGRTGCTVVLLPEGTVASGEVRGGAPGTREWELLDPGRLVSHVDAVVLCGGSAFGLAACDGVARWCEEHGRGFPTAAGPVPIVVGAVLYDLGVGDPKARPGPDAGYAACATAAGSGVATGRVGAGTGATVAKWRGPQAVQPGGVGGAALADAGLVVGALFAVNASGQLLDPTGPPPPWPAWRDDRQGTPRLGGLGSPLSSTTIGVVATNARLEKSHCRLLAESAHDGMARALEPVHTRYDGDAVVAAATGGVDAPLELVRLLAARATTLAIRAAVGEGPSEEGVGPGGTLR
jgi:L-aminopeptidase/D-esterase-like protein